MKVRARYLLFETANPRHGHEWTVFRDRRAEIPDDRILVPGAVDTTTNFVEHPELVAQRLRRFTDIVGRDRVIAGSDCGFGTFAGFGAVDPEIAWAKLATLAEGARRVAMTPLVLLPGMMCDARLFGPQIAALSASACRSISRRSAATTRIDGAGRRGARPRPAALRAARPLDGRHRRDGGAAPGPGPGRAARAPRHQSARRGPRSASPPRCRRSRKARAGGLAGGDARRDEAELPRRRPAPAATSSTSAWPWRSRSGPRSSSASPARSPPAPTSRRRSRAFRGPALVLMGEDDRLCPRDRHELMHALIPGSRLAVLEGAGHLPTLEQPERDNGGAHPLAGGMMDETLLTLLRSVDTPTVCNAIEVAQGRRGFDRFTRGTMLCLGPARAADRRLRRHREDLRPEAPRPTRRPSIRDAPHGLLPDDGRGAEARRRGRRGRRLPRLRRRLLGRGQHRRSTRASASPAR